MLISKLFISLALSMGLIPSTEARLKYVGINVSSGEFGVYSPGNPGFGLPGRFPDDYQFIDKSAIDVQISQGINLFRLSFLVERMCPPSYGLGPKFNETVGVGGHVNSLLDLKALICLSEPDSIGNSTTKPFNTSPTRVPMS